jgi:hypothetical protein
MEGEEEEEEDPLRARPMNSPSLGANIGLAAVLRGGSGMGG